MHAQRKKKVFLLGGGDLEMKTIKDILKKSSDYVMVDKDLKWDDALLSKYAEELVQYSSDDYKIYGIELRADITVPKNYIRIDHHNDLQNMPSALEQIAKIIQHELTDEEKLIVANDKGYYPGMKEYLDKTYPEMTEEDKKCMMYEIRKRDRAAQGVTEEQEEKAKEFYMYSENTDFATFVQVNKDIPFSSIADALWPYERLVIYNKEKTNLCFYGKEALEILEYISKKHINVPIIISIVEVVLMAIGELIKVYYLRKRLIRWFRKSKILIKASMCSLSRLYGTTNG